MSQYIDDLIALAALGELTDDEERELLEAAEADPAIAAELADALAAAAEVQATVAEAPRAGLRAQVLSQISQETQEPALARQGDTPTTVLPSSPPVSNVVPLASRRRTVAWVAGVAAALVLAVGVGAALRNDQASSDPVAAIVDADDAVTRAASGSAGELAISYSPSEGAVAVIGDVDAINVDQTYQLWSIVDDEPRSLGVFRPDAGGAVAVRVDGVVDPAAAVLAVTIEPLGGSAAPTTPVVISTTTT